MLIGVDVSGWNNLSANDGADFTIVKATEGVGWKSDMLSSWINKITGGKPSSSVRYGFYHYARPELGNTPEQEARWFLSVVKDHVHYAALALDWEGSALSYPSDWALKFMQHIREETGSTVLLYTSASEENTGKYNNIRDAGFPLWIACWGDSPSIRNWPAYTIWQFTNTPVDKNKCPDNSVWKSLAKNYGLTNSTSGWKVLEKSGHTITLENEALKITLEKV